MNHTPIKILLISDVIRLISNKYKISLREATDMYYSSKVSKMMADDECGLYGESALYIFSLIGLRIILTDIVFCFPCLEVYQKRVLGESEAVP